MATASASSIPAPLSSVKAFLSEKHGLDSTRVPRVLYGDWSAASGYEQGRRLAPRDDVTAIFAANDQMAMGILRAFHEAGREIPGDVSVVGFDDVPEAEFQMVPLTTVGVDADEAYMLPYFAASTCAQRAQSAGTPKINVSNFSVLTLEAPRRIDDAALQQALTIFQNRAIRPSPRARPALFIQVNRRGLAHCSSKLAKLRVHPFHLFLEMVLIDRAHFLRVFGLQ
jgi:hypothetical protein